MRNVVVYYSMTGNTEFAAAKIADKLGADMIWLEPEKSYPNQGVSKFFWGGKSAVMGEKPKLKVYEFEGEKYDRIIFGFPVWAGTFAPPIRTFIAENKKKLAGKHFAAFVCQSGNGALKALEKLKKLLGVEELDAELILVDPKDKPSPENQAKFDAFLEQCDM